MTFSEYVKFVIRGLNFVFSDVFPCRLTFVLPQKKLDAFALPEKNVLNEAEESEGLFPTIQKDERSALLFNSVNLTIPATNLVLKRKISEAKSNFQSFE